MSRGSIKLLVLILVCFAALPAQAAEGRIPVWGPSGGTVTIAADGRYIVTRNISGPGPGAAILITAGRVDLDLNGFTIDNPGVGAVIEIGSPVVEVTIHDGTLRDGGVSILRAPAGPGRKVVIENVKSEDSGGPGFHLFEIETVVIRRNKIIDAAGAGILLDTPPFKHGEISHNTIKRTGADAIQVVSGAAMEISHNQIEVAGNGVPGAGNGITLLDSVGCLIGENMISDPSTEGILLRNSRGNKLFNNVVRHAFATAIHLDATSGDNLLLHNVATDSGFDTPPGHGLWIEGFRNHIEGNTLNANESCGLLFDALASLNTFGRNMARGNGPGVCPSALIPCSGLLFPPESCDVPGPPASNDSSLENMIPGPPPF